MLNSLLPDAAGKSAPESTPNTNDAAFLGSPSVETYFPPSTAQPRNHLVFVDSSVDNIDRLVEGIASAQVVLLDREQDGIEQITKVLADYKEAAEDTDALLGAPYGGGLVDGAYVNSTPTNSTPTNSTLVDSVHVISHGDRATLTLGNTTLNTNNLAEYEAEIRQWSESLGIDADILLYGCDVAEGESGEQFVRRISELTGADVAASDDLTGADGDWDLEVTSGSIEAQLAVDTATQAAYEGTLASYGGKEYLLTNGAKNWEAAQAEAKSLGGNLVTINDGAEERWLKQTFGEGETFWLGLSDRAQEGQFEWVSGEAVTYTNWDPNEPNNYQGNEDYATMNFSWRKQWNDDSGSRAYRGIMEIDSTDTAEEKSYSGSRYMLTNGSKNWEAAQAEARQKGGNLVTINSAAEEQWIKQNFGESRSLWIGLNDRAQEGQFEWVSGEAVTYTNWAPGEPNNAQGDQDYGRMNYGSNQQWDDHFTNINLQGLIEIKDGPDTPIEPDPPNPPTPSNPGGIALETNLISVNEDSGRADIKIVRKQGSDGDITVDYRTADNSAQQGLDYSQRRGTVTFKNGEIEKVIQVPIINDNQSEGAELFNLTIDNVQGGASLLAPRTAQITINDDDAPAPPPPSPEKTFRGNRYRLTSSAKTWEAAQAEARQNNGNLVTINSAEEETWLKQTFSADESFWIGFTDKANEGQFRWASGEQTTYTNWDPNEPNNYGGNEDYTTMNFSWRKQWNDDSASRSFRGIIEIGGNNTPDEPKPPNPSTLNKETIYSGLSAPTAIEWTPDSSKMFIAEKGGVVKVAENGQVLPTNFIDISGQVNTANDRGLLDIAVHPNFPSNPYVYLLFTYDPPEVYGSTSTGLAAPDQPGNRAGRLVRVTANANTGYRTAVNGSEVVLLGKNSTWENFNAFTDSTFDFNAPPAGIRPDGENIQDFLAADSQSHSIGTIEFGTDGALYVSNGDGTSYNRPDPRSARVQDIDNLSGKILRINPITGEGLSNNPFFNGNADANRSKVYQLGLRNPFRFAINPSTGQPVIGDVGWKTWEEINAAGAGANFGWPYFEGDFRTGEYQDFSEAQAFYNSSPNVASPNLSLNHNTGINAVIMGDIYDGSAFPDKYTGDVFFNDVGRGIVSHANIDSSGNISGVEVFDQGNQFVVQMKTGPDGNLYYVDLDDGRVGRWSFG